MKTLITRLGENSRMIVTGDPIQVDLPSGQISGLNVFFLMIRRPPRSTPFPTRRSSDLHAGVRERLRGRERRLGGGGGGGFGGAPGDRKSTRLNSSHANISYAVFCLK